MNRFDVIAFDLDGTLVDSAGGVAHALNSALTEEGLPACAPALVKTWIGDGPDATIVRALASFGLDASAAELAPRLRQRFDAATLRSPMEGSTVYDGIRDVVHSLASCRPLVVVTNKPTRLSEAVLRAAGLLPFFAAVHGGDEPAQRKPSPALILQAAAGVGATPERLLMVGDGSVDIAAALAAGAVAAWAGWGYGRPPAEARDDVWRLAAPSDLLLQLALPARANA